MNDTVLALLSESTGRHRHFAIDTYRRFLQDYGILVNKVDSSLYRDILTRARLRDDVDSDTKLSTDALLHVLEEFKRITDAPEDPYDQLRAVIDALFQSWKDERWVGWEYVFYMVIVYTYICVYIYVYVTIYACTPCNLPST